jgi:hypothetical protein
MSVLLVVAVAALDAYIMYSTWYGKVIFWGLLFGVAALLVSRLADGRQLKWQTLGGRIRLFWMYLELLEEDFLQNFTGDSTVIFRAVGATILRLNSDPALKAFLLKHYEPLVIVDFKEPRLGDTETVVKYHQVFTGMAMCAGLRDNLLLEARKSCE